MVFGNSVSADLVKMRSFYKRLNSKSNMIGIYIATDQGKEGYVTMKVETAELQCKLRNAQDCLQPPEARKNQERILPPIEPLKGA